MGRSQSGPANYGSLTEELWLAAVPVAEALAKDICSKSENRHHDAEDLAQELLLRLASAPPEALDSMESIRGWMRKRGDRIHEDRDPLGIGIKRSQRYRHGYPTYFFYESTEFDKEDLICHMDRLKDGEPVCAICQTPFEPRQKSRPTDYCTSKKCKSVYSRCKDPSRRMCERIPGVLRLISGGCFAYELPQRSPASLKILAILGYEWLISKRTDPVSGKRQYRYYELTKSGHPLPC